MIDLIEHEADSQDSSLPLVEEAPAMPSTTVMCNTLENLEIDKPIKSTTQADRIAILTEAIESLAKHKPDMFKPSSRCKPPHLNIDVLRDDLFQSDFLQRHSLATISDLLTKLHEINQKQKIAITQIKAGDVSKSMQSATQKAIEHEFFLGLDKAWIYK